MRSNIVNVVRKEFFRFFQDKRLVMTTLLMPGLLIYIVYSFMGKGLMNQFSADENHKSVMYIENMPESLEGMISEMNVQIEDTADVSEDSIKQEIKDKKTDLYMIFPADFDQAVAAYSPQDTAVTAPQITIYYNSAETNSMNSYTAMQEMLSSYESSLANKFDVNTQGADYDMATDKDSTGQLFSMMLPMLLMIFIFTGCMAVAPEAIAGEKERGTIATLLVTPLKRSELAIGKIISLSVIALLAGTSSFIGTMLSLPNLMGMESAADGSGGISAGYYTVGDYAVLFLIILSSVLIIISAISIISAFAKSVKEASTAVTPLMVLVMLVAVSGMITKGAPKGAVWYLIPLYNSVQCMNGVFSFSYSMVNVLITVGANLVCTILLAYVLTKLFDSEKVMFSR